MSAILGIETSCDETAASVVVDGHEVLSNSVASQIKEHSLYGGVVPELAAREHLKAIGPVLDSALKEAGLALKDIDAVAVTNGPGLMPALLVGLNFAKGIAVANKLPFKGINHFTAHIYGSFLNEQTGELAKKANFPLLALVVSGGHTALVLISYEGKMELVGTTLDDAAGEALDKAAKLLGLGYPGGPVIEKAGKMGDPLKYDFPRSLTGASGKEVSRENRFNFSFSGLKTSLLYHCRRIAEDRELGDQEIFDTAASYEEAVIDVLHKKTLDAAAFFNAGSITLCGGVACNSLLRRKFRESLSETGTPSLFISPPRFCTDNAAMVAALAYHYFSRGESDSPDIDAFARLPEITEVPLRS